VMARVGWRDVPAHRERRCGCAECAIDVKRQGAKGGYRSRKVMRLTGRHLGRVNRYPVLAPMLRPIIGYLSPRPADVGSSGPNGTDASFAWRYNPSTTLAAIPENAPMSVPDTVDLR